MFVLLAAAAGRVSFRPISESWAGVSGAGGGADCASLCRFRGFASRIWGLEDGARGFEANAGLFGRFGSRRAAGQGADDGELLSGECVIGHTNRFLA
jgi:hypothetical protein